MNKSNEASRAFFVIPKELFSDSEYSNLSVKAKILYALMLDRTKISELNGWKDENGETFIYFSFSEISEKLDCGKNYPAVLIAELEAENLIRKKKVGLGRPVRYYIGCGKLSPKAGNSTPAESETGFPQNGKQDSRKSGANNNEKNNNELSNNLLKGSEEDEVKENIGYDYLLTQESKDDVDSIVSIICDTLRSKNEFIRIGADVFPCGEVFRRLRSLNEEHIIYVLGTLYSTKTQIRDIRAYILKLLFHSVSTMELYYSAKICADRNSIKN